jgi:hypothetical protein
MSTSALRTRLDNTNLGQHELHAAGTANDDVEATGPKPAGCPDGLRGLQGHYSRRLNFLGSLLPRALAISTPAITVSTIGTAFGGPSFAQLSAPLGSTPAVATARLRAVGLAAVAALTDEEDGATMPAALTDHVE